MNKVIEAGNQLNEKINELKTAMCGTWLEAVETTIEAVEQITLDMYIRREWRLQDKLRRLPYSWQCWIAEHWPRKWLPRG